MIRALKVKRRKMMGMDMDINMKVAVVITNIVAMKIHLKFHQATLGQQVVMDHL